MLSCPKLIAEFDRLAQLCRDADADVQACIHGKLSRPLWQYQSARDRAEDRYHKFCDQHGVMACLSRYPGH